MDMRWEIFAKNIMKFVSESDSKTPEAEKSAKNMFGSVQFASTCMGVDTKQACQDRVNVIIKRMDALSEEDFKKLFILCNGVGVKVGESNE